MIRHISYAALGLDGASRSTEVAARPIDSSLHDAAGAPRAPGPGCRHQRDYWADCHTQAGIGGLDQEVGRRGLVLPGDGSAEAALMLHCCVISPGFLRDLAAVSRTAIIFSLTKLVSMNGGLGVKNVPQLLSFTFFLLLFRFIGEN